MTLERINHDYLSQLFEISREQSEDGLIDHLFRSLQAEHAEFVRHPIVDARSPDERRELQSKVHRLKNVYFNLGCEQVGQILEDMYQALKSEDQTRRLPALWNDFTEEAQVTMDQLRREITALTH